MGVIEKPELAIAIYSGVTASTIRLNVDSTTHYWHKVLTFSMDFAIVNSEGEQYEQNKRFSSTRSKRI